jgi:hypothetical protein
VPLTELEKVDMSKELDAHKQIQKKQEDMKALQSQKEKHITKTA